MNEKDKMKRLTIILSAIIFMAASVQAQKADPVHFTYSVSKAKDQGYEVHITAAIDNGWHIYSQTQPDEAIAQPTAIVFVKNPLITMTGKPKEEGTKEKYEDKTAGIVQYQYSGKLDFVQAVTIKAKVKTNISGTITYQACTDEMCLP